MKKTKKQKNKPTTNKMMNYIKVWIDSVIV